MIKNKWVIFAFVLVCVSFLQGCGLIMDKPYIKKDLVMPSAIKVVRYETPTISKLTAGGSLAGFVVGGGLGVGTAGDIAGKKLSERGQLPDFGDLVMKKFVGRVSKEIPNWPIMTMEEQPINEDYRYQSGCLIEFKVGRITLMYPSIFKPYGIETVSIIKMVDSGGNVLWRKIFRYWSGNFDRLRNLDEWEADNAKLF